MRPTILLLFLALPLRHLQVTSAFGNRIHPLSGNYQQHAGVDLKANYDTVYAIMDAHLSTSYQPGLGIFIRLTNGALCVTYGHLSQVFASDSVRAGTAIGISGATGRVTGPHLHLAVQFNHRYIDPLAFVAAGFQQMNH